MSADVCFVFRFANFGAKNVDNCFRRIVARSVINKQSNASNLAPKCVLVELQKWKQISKFGIDFFIGRPNVKLFFIVFVELLLYIYFALVDVTFTFNFPSSHRVHVFLLVVSSANRLRSHVGPEIDSS